jgi:hypothetical protein
MKQARIAGTGIVLALFAFLVGCSEDQPAPQPSQPEAIGRINNAISVDTCGCLSFALVVKWAGSSTTSIPGCMNLDQGRRVIGPLEIRTTKIGKNGDMDFKFARIEVPGKGDRWTFLAHLERK